PTNDLRAGSAAMIVARDCPPGVHAVLFWLAYESSASRRNIVDSSWSAAVPEALRYVASSGCSAGFDCVNPLTAQPSAPASSVPSIAAVVAARSAGGAPA